MVHSFMKLLALSLFSTIIPQTFAAPAAVGPSVTISAGTIIGTAIKPANQPHSLPQQMPTWECHLPSHLQRGSLHLKQHLLGQHHYRLKPSSLHAFSNSLVLARYRT